MGQKFIAADIDFGGGLTSLATIGFSLYTPKFREKGQTTVASSKAFLFLFKLVVGVGFSGELFKQGKAGRQRRLKRIL